MLEHLAIRDIVLIDRLELGFAPGLSALTGETGAGKSIILDALSLALGARGDRGLVRTGAGQGTVTAVFALTDPAHPARLRLAEQGLEAAEELVLRRVLGSDGRSRAFVNDQPVGTSLLRELGETLVEIHGQMEQQGLLSTATHRALLDAFGGHAELTTAVRAAHDARAAARATAMTLRADLEAAARELDYLRHRERELADLAAQPGEEEELAGRRTRLQQRGRLGETLAEALAAVGGAVERLAAVQRRLGRAGTLDAALLEPLATAVERAAVEAAEAEAALEAATRTLDDDGGSLETVEERLFALRAAARKHRVAADELPELLERTRAELAAIDTASDRLLAAERAVAATDAAYVAAAERLSTARAGAAVRLAEAMLHELPPLRLEKARFRVTLEPLPAEECGPHGAERVQFEVATNPGQPFGALGRLASGGELSRLMLALKVVLAGIDGPLTLIFDEVDAGIGGATADAVGERLARLGERRQVLVVTHAPQVAARARHHLRVVKTDGEGTTRIAVERLDSAARREEIARMLAGAAVTPAAREAARSLIRAAR